MIGFNKTVFLNLVIFNLNLTICQEVKFQVEVLSKPDTILIQAGYEEIYEELILEDLETSKWEMEYDNIDVDYGIIAKSAAPDSLVNFRYHPFFRGMERAYADHRPFTLSPDMIWLLICQGFAKHVNVNAEILRNQFVEFEGKLGLFVESEQDLLTEQAEWDEVFPNFTKQIAKYTGQELIATLSSDFSTTTMVEKVATEITIMEAMEPYLEYNVVRAVCGIPEITLKGTTEDWVNILDKVRKLEKYNLRWWTKELYPILEQFVAASKGDIKKKFWRNMFKYHTPKKYGAPRKIDGWIVKFFPYDAEDNRNNLRRINGAFTLPNEMVKVDLKYIETGGLGNKETELELWAGFIGLEQNPDDFGLQPVISWMIRKKEDEKNRLKIMNKMNVPNRFYPDLNMKVYEVPSFLRSFREIYNLRLEFKKEINIPLWLSKSRIGKLEITGKISKEKEESLKKLFPNTELFVNDNYYAPKNKEWIIINAFDDTLKKYKRIWVLEFEAFEELSSIPDWISEINIEILTINTSITEDLKLELQEILPNTRIFVNGNWFTK